MALRFIGIDPNTTSGRCPAAWVNDTMKETWAASKADLSAPNDAGQRAHALLRFFRAFKKAVKWGQSSSGTAGVPHLSRTAE